MSGPGVAAAVHWLWLCVFAAWTAGEIALLVGRRIGRSEQAGGDRDQDRGTLRLLWTTVALSIAAGQWMSAAFGPVAGWEWIPLVALALLVAGVTLRVIAVRTLGHAFSVNVAICPGQRVVRHGVYAMVRHPSYTALMGILCGVGLETGNAAALAVTLLPPVAALLRRIHVEEQALSEALGAEYADYARCVRYRLIPGLW